MYHRNMPKVKRKCKLCQKEFYVERWQLKNNKCIYCSHKCANEVNEHLRVKFHKGQIPWNKGKHYRNPKCGLANIGRIPWNKGKKLGKNPEHSLKIKGRHLSPKTEFQKGEHHCPKNEFRKGHKLTQDDKHPMWKGGKPNCEVCGKKLSNYHFRRCAHCRLFSEKHRENLSNWQKGNKSRLWRGGVTPLRLKIWNSREYRQWRTSVFDRDNYTCQECGSKNGDGKTIYIEAHHMKSFAEYPKLRFELSNGITLCIKCHNKTKNGRPRL